MPDDGMNKSEEAYEAPDLFVGAIINKERDNVSDLWFAVINFNDFNVKFKLDTGSEANILPRSIFDNIPKLTPSRCTLMTYTGQPEGETILQLKGLQMRFQVTMSASAILGKNACVALAHKLRIVRDSGRKGGHAPPLADFGDTSRSPHRARSIRVTPAHPLPRATHLRQTSNQGSPKAPMAPRRIARGSQNVRHVPVYD